MRSGAASPLGATAQAALAGLAACALCGAGAAVGRRKHTVHEAICGRVRLHARSNAGTQQRRRSGAPQPPAPLRGWAPFGLHLTPRDRLGVTRRSRLALVSHRTVRNGPLGPPNPTKGVGAAWSGCQASSQGGRRARPAAQWVAPARGYRSDRLRVWWYFIHRLSHTAAHHLSPLARTRAARNK